MTAVVDRTRLPRPGPAPAARFPAVARRRLASGMALRTGRHPGPPVVHWLLLWPSGAAADPPARPGLAALAAALLDEGTEARSVLELHGALDRLGARLGVQVGADATMVSLTTLEHHAAEGLALLFEIVTRPRFAAGDFDRVRDLRRSRVRQMRTVPAAVAERVYLETLYHEHPYGHLGIGTDAALSQMTVDDVRRFHGERYRLGAATLIATGPLSDEAFADVAERAVGNLPAGAADVREPAAGAAAGAPGPPPARLVLVDRPGAVQSELRIGHVAAPRRTPDYYALKVLNMVLGGQFVSRLNRSLREEKGYTYGVRTAFQFRRAPGPFVIQGSVQGHAPVEAVRQGLGEVEGV
ncbi:MAG: pitrilysin family protein, partial [Acidobacteria bacterium]|nr:pitrilysin family protein [Acidobacteriota bacterium]